MKNLIPLVLTASALIACGGGNPAGSSLQLSLTVSANDLVPGQQAALTLTATSDGEMVDTDGATFASAAINVAAVTNGGLVTAVAVGTARITTTLRGATASLLVRVVAGGMISAAGGTVQLAGGAVELVVPPGALPGETAIRLSTSSAGNDPTAVEDATYSIGSENLTFAVPATLRLRYQALKGPFGLPAAALGLRRAEGNGWSDIRPSTVNAGAGHVTAEVVRGGIYGVGRLVPTTPCEGPAYRAFDFWVGAWTVTTPSGQPNGESFITMEQGGCAIFERYVTPTPLSPGLSISHYEPETDKWYQTYVDAGGNRLDIESTSFTATSLVTQSPRVGNSWGVFSWVLQPDGTVRQTGETTANNGQTFQPSFDLIYTRKP